MAAVPTDIPVTTPVEDPTVATPGEPDVHLPPATESLKVVVLPSHKVVVPLMIDGIGFTVRIAYTDPQMVV